MTMRSGTILVSNVWIALLWSTAFAGAAKQRAARLAETIKGVLSVRNDIVVVPRTKMSADDMERVDDHLLVEG